MDSLEQIYRQHHAERRGEGFMLLGKERGEFLRNQIGTGKKVLDIGCRDGALTSAYSKGNEVLGLDIDSVALDAARKLGIETRYADLNGDWNVPAKQFDFVVAAEVLEHLYYPDVVASKIAQVLKPTGVLLGSIPNAFSIKNRIRWLFLNKRNTPMVDPTHINQFTVKEFRTILEAQFDRVSIYGIGRYHRLAAQFPQTFAFDLLFVAERPKK